MKVIDLLNIKWNGNQLPAKIEYEERIYHLNDNWYYNEKGNTLDYEFYIYEILNDEIEIIEEEKKIELPEKLNENFSNYYFDSNNELSNELQDLKITINELIDYLKYKEEESKK